MTRISTRIAGLGIGVLLLAACGSSSDTTTRGIETAPTGCEAPGKPPKGSPALEITPGAKYAATIATSEGVIDLALDACTQLWGANNFVSLARKGFYDNTTIHRVAADFVIQGGDPNGDGTGGPGYEFVSELPANGYQVGDIAWAKTGAAPPGSAGSQWFIISTERAADQVFNRPPYLYGQFGRVTSGMDVVMKINDLAPASGDGTPTKPVTITKVTITGP